MSEAMENISYFSVIPYPVLSSQTLRDKTKLVYGLIASLAKNEGYCWASNEELAAIMCCGERTITRAVAELVDAGELVVRIVGAVNRKGNRERRIYTKETAARSLAQIGSTASLGEASLANLGETLNNVDNINPIIPPTAPQGRQHGPKDPKWKPKRFAAFWQFYRGIFCVSDHSRAGERAAAATAWDKLKPDDATIKAMGAKLTAIMKTRQWQDGYGIKMASTFLNGVRLNKIDLADLPEVEGGSTAPQRSQRRYKGTEIIDGQEVDVYE